MIRFVLVMTAILTGCGANLASPALAETVVAKTTPVDQSKATTKRATASRPHIEIPFSVIGLALAPPINSDGTQHHDQMDIYPTFSRPATAVQLKWWERSTGAPKGAHYYAPWLYQPDQESFALGASSLKSGTDYTYEISAKDRSTGKTTTFNGWFRTGGVATKTPAKQGYTEPLYVFNQVQMHQQWFEIPAPVKNVLVLAIDAVAPIDQDAAIWSLPIAVKGLAPISIRAKNLNTDEDLGPVGFGSSSGWYYPPTLKRNDGQPLAIIPRGTAQTILVLADVGHVDKPVSMIFALLTKPCSGIGAGCADVPMRFGMTRTIVPTTQQ